MKKLAIASIFLLLFTSVQAADGRLPCDSLTGKISYSGIFEVKRSMADPWAVLYEWMVKNSETEVVQVDHGEISKLIGKSKVQVFESNGDFPAGHIQFTMTIAMRNGRYRYQFTDFVHRGQMLNDSRLFPDLGPLENLCIALQRVQPLFARRTCENIRQQVDESMRRLLSDLDNSLRAGLQEYEEGW